MNLNRYLLCARRALNKLRVMWEGDYQMTGNLPICSHASGERVWRDDMYNFGDWAPDEDEVQRGPRTEFADGIYVVTVHEQTPADWLGIAMKATIASSGQHPGPDLLPADRYDSFIAVLNGRIVGGALVALDEVGRYRWTIHLKPAGSAHTAEDLSITCGNTCHLGKGPETSLPAIYTIWMHPYWRNHGIGGQIVRAVAKHFRLPLDGLCFRLPLSEKAVGMTRALGLIQVIGCF